MEKKGEDSGKARPAFGWTNSEGNDGVTNTDGSYSYTNYRKEDNPRYYIDNYVVLYTITLCEQCCFRFPTDGFDQPTSYYTRNADGSAHYKETPFGAKFSPYKNGYLT